MRRVFFILFALTIVISFTDSSISQNKEIKNRAKSFFEEGIYHFNNKAFVASTNAFMRALYNAPNYYKARYWLGKAYLHSGYIKNALIEWEQVLNLVGKEDYFLKNKIMRLLNQTVQPNKPSFEEPYVETKNFMSQSLSRPSSIYLDRDENYWVTGYSSSNILIFNKNGREIANLSSPAYPFKHPYGIVQNSMGDFFVSDFGNDMVYRVSAGMKYLSSFGTSGISKGSFMGPMGITVDNHDNIYVVDKGNHRIQKFNSNGDFLMDFGSKGYNANNLFSPTDIVIVEGKYALVSDTGNKRIQVFDLSGNWLRSILAGVVLEPMGIKKIDENTFLIADKQKGIIKFNLEPLTYKLIKPLDINMNGPLDMEIDGNNFIYVVDLSSSSLLGYVPESMKYSNLDVNVLQTLSSNYPFVTQRVLVKDQFGRSILGLDNLNFNLYESGVLHTVDVKLEADTKKDLSLLIVNERSFDMMEHSKELSSITKGILSKMTNNDDVKVINFNSSYWEAQDFTNNAMLVTRSLLSKSNYAKEKNIGNAMYEGISKLLRQRQSTKAAVLIITSGNLSEDAFLPYGYDVCLSFAKNNIIPIYVLSFSNNSSDDYILKQIADKTGGRYFRAYAPNNLLKLLDFVRSYKEGVYYVRHKSRFSRNSGSKSSLYNKWRDIKLEVKVKDLIGQDKSEYFLYN